MYVIFIFGFENNNGIPGKSIMKKWSEQMLPDNLIEESNLAACGTLHFNAPDQDTTQNELVKATKLSTFSFLIKECDW